ncbi:MAG: alpha/beta fold hydrolase [Armatimonadetes bacterium]|nr:alpha/beta fold hydrolase [Armatimonadota bacterium]
MSRATQIAAGTGLTLAGVAGLNALVQSSARKLPNALKEGERHTYEWRYGRVSYQVAGEGQPLLLIHGVYAGASNFEWRHNFGALADNFRAYAIDLLGFGRSDRPTITYTDDLYTDLIHDFVRDVVADPAFAIASSVSASFLVADAAATPDAYRGLILICPQEIEGREGQPGGVAGRAYASILRTPLVGTALYNSLVSTPRIRSELRKVRERTDGLDNETVRYYHRSSHQPGAKWATSSFLSGDLRRNIRGEFRSLQMPVLLVWGDRAAYSPVENAAAYLAANPRASLQVFEECGNQPHEEYPDRFNDLVLCQFQALVPAE